MVNQLRFDGKIANGAIRLLYGSVAPRNGKNGYTIYNITIFVDQFDWIVGDTIGIARASPGAWRGKGMRGLVPVVYKHHRETLRKWLSFH